MAFTVCAADGCMNLANTAVFRSLHSWLTESCVRHQATLIIITAMPDHLHVLLVGDNEDADLWSAMTLFKQKCGYQGRRSLPGLRLQGDFYDHVLRRDEDTPKQARYIAGNPVRAGLAGSWDAWPYTYAVDDLRFW